MPLVTFQQPRVQLPRKLTTLLVGNRYPYLSIYHLPPSLPPHWYKYLTIWREAWSHKPPASEFLASLVSCVTWNKPVNFPALVPHGPNTNTMWELNQQVDLQRLAHTKSIIVVRDYYYHCISLYCDKRRDWSLGFPTQSHSKPGDFTPALECPHLLHSVALVGSPFLTASHSPVPRPGPGTQRAPGSSEWLSCAWS